MKRFHLRILTTLGVVFFFALSGCNYSSNQPNSQPSNQSNLETHQDVLQNPELFHQALQSLTDVIVHDIFSPPVASRIYVYPCIAAYEVLAQTDSDDSKLRSLEGQLNGLSKTKVIEFDKQFSPELAAIFAFLETGKQLVFSQEKLEQASNQLRETLLNKAVEQNLIDASFEVGILYSEKIMAWAKKDNYAKTRSSAKYSFSDEPGKWIPTPPAFMEGIEPNWRNMRTMVIGELNKFAPPVPTQFSLDKSSQFFQEVLETKNAVDNATPEHKEIAAFWDCNPYVMNVTGHTMFASKKITPGGHWMGIVSIAAQQSQLDIAKSIEIHTLTAIAIYDAFISCWDEKYRSNLVRPETVINLEIDQDWKPLLQTPPFPEHTSGHSVISTAAAEILTAYFGDNYTYSDDVEEKYGLPIRSYSSFREAASEAAISRLYGGIHFRPAIDEGVIQGQKIGQQILNTISTSDYK